jgi:predicted phage tail protein
MKKGLTQITLHGELGESIGKTWNLSINSVGEAMHAIEILSKRKLYKWLLEKDKAGVKYKVISNGKEIEMDKDIKPHELDKIKTSELTISNTNLQTIDIVPVIEGADDVVNVILGALLIIAGVVFLAASLGVGTPISVGLIIAGIGLVAGGVVGLLSSPPQFEPFQEAKGTAASYLFNGPENTVQEGGPVPVIYGNLLVGSQVIAASYDIKYRDASKSPLTY